MVRENGKTDKLEKILLTELLSGKYSHGMRFYSSREAAEKFGFSLATAYRALAGLAEKGHLTSRNGLGIFVNAPGKNSCQLRAVAVPLRLESNPQVLDFYEQLSTVAEKRGIRLLMGNGENWENEEAFLQKLAAVEVDGVIRFPCGVSQKESRIRAKISELNLKCVNINDWWRPESEFPSVKNDEERAVTEILDALYSAGHRKITLVQETYTGLRMELQKAFWQWHWHKNLKLTSNSMFCSHDQEIPPLTSLQKAAAAGTTALIFAYGLNIRDIWNRETAGLLQNFTLTTLDNIPLTENNLFAAYRHDDEKMAQTALDLLANSGENPKVPVKIPGKLIFN
ncbi:MAG: GntR family transcriptional regulator [Lentisphaerae bacterium]|nr:GntR family transcriptional regulator [Lentisphaerota bacterium]